MSRINNYTEQLLKLNPFADYKEAVIELIGNMPAA
jgi:hypothetical protein